jgi:hypothetical protein
MTQQYWYCPECFSQNRANANHCYKCQFPRARAAEAAGTGPTYGSAGTGPTYGSAGTGHEAGTVLTPGVDEEHRQAARAVMDRGYTSAWKLGYLSAGSLAATVVLLVIAVVFWLPRLDLAIQNRQPEPNTLLETGANLSLAALCLVGLFSIVAHSIFLSLSSRAAPALGSGSPGTSPAEAGVWWIESELSALGGVVAINVPLVFTGLFGVVAKYLLGQGGAGFWVLGNPIGYFGRPGHLLADLWQRLGVPGSEGTRTITIWSIVWGIAQLVFFVSTELVGLGLVYLSIRSAHDGRPLANAQGASVTATLFLVVAIIELLAVVVSLCLLAGITYELARRQRTREAWVLSAEAGP